MSDNSRVTRAWWLPRWLGRVLPEVDVEGEKLQRPTSATGATEVERELEPARWGGWVPD